MVSRFLHAFSCVLVPISVPLPSSAFERTFFGIAVVVASSAQASSNVAQKNASERERLIEQCLGKSQRKTCTVDSVGSETCSAVAVRRTEYEDEAHRENVDRALCTYWFEAFGYSLEAADRVPIDRIGSGAVDGSQDTAVERSPGDPICKASTYGEVPPVGVRQIVHAMGISNASEMDSVVFIDLGSGVGKVVAQAIVEWPAVRSARGVELSAARSTRAREVWKEFLASGEATKLRQAALARRNVDSSAAATSAVSAVESVRFEEGDMFLANVRDVTHIFVPSLCFGDKMLQRLSEKLSSEADAAKVVATLRPFPNGISGFDKVETFVAHMSWMASGVRTHLYKRQVHATT
eukprot:TRINITY_DN27613_c0_g1_i1.p1 TRINITY_DN27613_c0_g1~~TRINITY_DN27613_c0_g1_i1.p1  ORF type:complete len:363 (-),score=64.08 TRINITY_DN27613_c0_g1_i1:109-1161(-)